MDATEFGMTTEVSGVSWSAPSPMEVTELGMTTEVSGVSWNAPAPMEVTESGMVTIYDRDIPSGKVLELIVGRSSLEAAVDTMVTEVRFVYLKASIPMEVTESGMVTAVN